MSMSQCWIKTANFRWRWLTHEEGAADYMKSNRVNGMVLEQRWDGDEGDVEWHEIEVVFEEDLE